MPPARATEKAPDRSHAHPIASCAFVLWLYGEDGDALSSEDIASSPRLRAHLDPSALSGLVPGSHVLNASGGAGYYAGSDGVPVKAALAGEAQTWTGLQTFGDGIALLDNDAAIFGTGADVSQYWDAAKLVTIPIADDTLWEIGNGTLSMDLTIYGNSAGAHTKWDASANTLILTGVKLTTAAVQLGGIVDSPMTAAQVLGAADTITLPTTGMNKAVSSAAARVDTVLTAGTIAGQMIVLMNANVSGGDSITFHATPATSRVALASYVLVAGRATMFTWNATASLWFPVGA